MRRILTSKTPWTMVALVLLTGAWTRTASAQAAAPGLDVAAQTAANYRLQARYPEHSRVIAAGAVDPVLDKRVPAPHSSAAGRSASGLMLTVWADQTSFQHPSPVLLRAAVTGGDTRGIQVTGEVVDATGRSLGTVIYRDRDGDGLFGGILTVPPERVPELAESFLIKVEAAAPNGEVARAAGGFLYSNPGVAVTGRFRDRVVDGDLVLGVQVEVERAGRFHLAGTLYTMQGEPIGWAQTARQLEPGIHWLELSFFGLMFHERGAAGPYRLGTLALSNASGMPNAPVDLVEDAHVTRPYPLRGMRSVPFDDPQLLDAAKRLEAVAKDRGR